MCTVVTEDLMLRLQKSSTTAPEAALWPSSVTPNARMGRSACVAPAGSISGDTFGISALPHDIFRPLQSVAPSGPWLFPDVDVFGDEVRRA